MNETLDETYPVPRLLTSPAVQREGYAGTREPPIVSIVLPVWNRQNFVAAAIESVMQQTFGSFELLVIDDGSTDRTTDVVESFVNEDSRICLMKRGHLGIVDALNEGILRSRGRYIARMDSDDIAHPARIERQVRYLDAHPQCVLVGSDAAVVDEEGESLGVICQPHHHEDILLALSEGKRTPFVHPTVMMRKEALVGAGGYRSESYPSEDLDLWVRLLDHGTLANIPEQLLLYRRHSDTVCAREYARQVANAALICNQARVRQGLTKLKSRKQPRSRNAAAVYHNECAHLALRAGRRKQAFRHACASIAADPIWTESYASLGASLLPSSLIKTVLQYRYHKRPGLPRVLAPFSSRE